MPLGNVEIYLDAGSDFLLTPAGDLVLAVDTYQNPVALIQRVIRLVLSNPRLFDGNGEPISVPDDPCNQGYGSGARAQVGEMQGQALLSALGARISKALASEPSIANIPAPTVTVTSTDNNTISVAIYAVSVTGEIITVPAFPISLGV